MKAFGSLAAAAMLIAAPVAAQDDIASKIINAPAPADFAVYGLADKPKPRKDASVQGGQSLRLSIPGASDQPYSISLSSAIRKPIKQGDRLVIAFWSRAERLEEGHATARIANVQVQLAAAPYTTVFRGEAEATPEWKLFEVQGRADRDYAAGEVNVTLHLATGKHVIDIGPIFLLDLGA